MGKRSKNKPADDFPQRLSTALENGEVGNLSAGAREIGIEPQVFEQAWDEARGLIQRGPDPRKIAALPGAFQVAMLRWLERQQDTEAVSDLFGCTADREARKEAKRILHRWRSQGRDVDLPVDTGPSVLDRQIEADEPPLPCYLSGVSGNGSRMVFLARFARGGVAVFQGELNDEQGLTQFGGGTIGRNRYRQLVGQLTADSDTPLLAVGWDEARWWLEQAVERCRTAGKPLPDGYLDASAELGSVDSAAAPAGVDPFSSEDLTALSDRGAELFEFPEFADWLPDEDTLTLIDSKIKEAEVSQVAINEQQRVDQVARGIEAGIEALAGDGEKRARFARRLADMAAFLVRLHRPEPARLAAAVARTLATEPQAGDPAPAANPFFDRMVRRVFRSPEEIVAHLGQGASARETPEESQRPEEGSLIIKP